MLIRHGDLPGIIQKVSAYYIIYDLFRSDGQTESPFLPFFFTVLEQNTIPTRLNIIEKNFLSQLLGNGTKEVSIYKFNNSTVCTYIDEPYSLPSLPQLIS